MHNLYDTHDKWEDLVEKAYSEGYDALTEHEKVWFNIQCLIQAVHNVCLSPYHPIHAENYFLLLIEKI